MSYVLAKQEGGHALMLTVRGGMWDLTATLDNAIRFFDARSAAQFLSTNDGLNGYRVSFREDETNGD